MKISNDWWSYCSWIMYMAWLCEQNVFGKGMDNCEHRIWPLFQSWFICCVSTVPDRRVQCHRIDLFTRHTFMASTLRQSKYMNPMVYIMSRKFQTRLFIKPSSCKAGVSRRCLRMKDLKRQTTLLFAATYDIPSLTYSLQAIGQTWQSRTQVGEYLWFGQSMIKTLHLHSFSCMQSWRGCSGLRW